MIKRILLSVVCSLLLSFASRAQYTQILHTSGTQLYSCTNVTVGPFWWWYTNQFQYLNGVNWTCGVGPYSDTTGNFNTWWGGYQFKFQAPVSAVRFQIADMQQYEWVEFYVNGVYYPLTSANISAFPGTCNQSLVSNYGYLYMNTSGTAGAQIDIVGNIDSVAVLTSGNYYYYYNNTNHDITYSAFFLDPNAVTVTPSSNNPSCGGTLNLYCNTITQALSYSWTGPNGFTSNQQNPTVGTATYLQSGTYTVTVTTACGTFTGSVTVSIVTPNAPTVVTPITYCVGQTASQLTAIGSNLLWYATQTGGVGNPTAPTPSTAAPNTFNTWVSQTVNGCESPRANITVYTYAVPSPPIVSSNSPVCSGNQITFTGSNTNNGVFSWTGPNNFTSALVSPTISNAQPVNAGTYSVTTTVNGCTSLPATLNVVVNPTPVIGNITSQNPTTCSGANGSITISGLTANTSYTISYSKNNIAQAPVTITSNGSGQVTITGLTAGIYSSIVVSLSGCTANSSATVTLTDPAAPSITITSTNSTNCATPNGSFTLHNLTAGTYTLSYTYNGTPQTPQTITVTGTQIVVNNLASGSYTNITVTNTTTNCTSNIVSATINGPTVPTIYAQVTDPSACNSSTGSILITGLTSNVSYMGNYTQNGTPVSFTQTALNGSINITGLPAGNYTNIFVVVNGCSTNVLGPLNLVDPNAPTPPTITYNGPVCAGQNINMILSPVPPNGTTYQWTGPNNFTSTQQIPTLNNVQVTMSGTYTLVITQNGCTSAPATINVVVNPVPVAPTAAANTPVCSGNTLNLSATSTTSGVSYVWSGPNNFNSTQQNPNINYVTTAATGSYTVYATANGCNSAPFSFNVNVTQTPNIIPTSVNPSSCGGMNGSITLSGLVNNSTYTVNYDKNGTPQPPLTLTATGSIVVIQNLGVGTYTNITATLNGCPSNIAGPITLVGPVVPPTPVATANSPLCEGDVLQLSSSTVTNATYVWSGPNSFTANTQNASINNVTTAATGVYSVIAVVNGCNSQPGTVNVLVSPQPAAPIVSNNGPVCEGNPLNLISNNIPGVTYSWSGPNAFNSTAQNPSIASAQLTDAGVYTLTISNGTCDATASTNVLVGPLPGLPVVNSPLEVCVDEIVTLTAQGQNLLWYTTPTGGVGQTSITPPTNTATTMTYYVSQSTNGCEGGRAPLVVIVNPLPAPPVATAAYTYCQDDPGATPLTATGTNLTWYDVPTGGTPLPGAPTPNTAIPGVFNYYVTESDVNCESHRTQITVTINAKPAAPPATIKEYCRNDAATALTATGQNLLWYTQQSGGTGSAIAPVPNTSATGTTDYFVSQTVNGCEGDRSQVRVIVHEKVSASLTAEPDDACTGKPVTITFTGSAPDSANYNWTFDGADVLTGSDVGPYTVEWDNSGDKVVTVTVTNHICSATASVTIDVDPTPVASFIMSEHGCVNTPVTIVADSGLTGLPGYTWTFAGGEVLSGTGAGPYSVLFHETGTKLVMLQLTNINCPSELAMDSITIHQPLAKINWDLGAAICSDDSVLFTAEPGLDNIYVWSPTIYFREGNASLSAWAIVATSSFVNLTVTDRWGCENKDSAWVTTTPCCDVFLPNAFSPNDDGKNDGFRMLTKGKQQLSKFIIVDRWGQIMFETANQYEAWDGTFKGEAMPIGTYQYYLKYRCAEGDEMIEKKGDVTLLR